jgi:hypothetical protein
MKFRCRNLLIPIAFLAVIAGCFITLIGPWPTYKSGFKDKLYYKEALAAIAQHGKRSSHNSAIGQFEAGWGSRCITPSIGTPLAGFGDRKGKPSTGVHTAPRNNLKNHNKEIFWGWVRQRWNRTAYCAIIEAVACSSTAYEVV